MLCDSGFIVLFGVVRCWTALCVYRHIQHDCVSWVFKNCVVHEASSLNFTYIQTDMHTDTHTHTHTHTETHTHAHIMGI